MMILPVQRKQKILLKRVGVLSIVGIVVKVFHMSCLVERYDFRNFSSFLPGRQLLVLYGQRWSRIQVLEKQEYLIYRSVS